MASDTGEGAGVVAGVAGILLTGGKSRRLGFDKASLLVNGEPLARRVGRVMSQVVRPLFEVGPGRSGLRSVTEDRPGCGPLVAVGEGHRALGDAGHRGAALVLACDLPLVDRPLLFLLAGWPGESSVVPVVGGIAQPLCARWSRSALDTIASRVDDGERSMRSLLEDEEITFVGEGVWSQVASEESFTDIDRLEDLDRLGLPWGVIPGGSSASGPPRKSR